MSKNVAVFVDVANIFYAAKAAGVDIDYVTLLKAAIAGRDFVRAYAYTGLDPDNENQRNFHSFLARNGYKVVSKDIRKYGDGKVKANLDIELVVDLMKTARNLDVAIIVSGDGDFAPAIRAVQEMGVRVEVISFKGNTSSDLFEVADVFSDITQLARVERGTRSGRRVAEAEEEDLSMTEVPDKQSEGAARGRARGRGRGRATEAEPVTARQAAASSGRGAPRAARPERRGAAPTPVGGLVALPGEKLSKAALAAQAAAAATSVGAGVEAEEEEAAAAEEEEATLGVEGAEGGQPGEGEGRRRRRRRGGRGRGRGRGRAEEGREALPDELSESPVRRAEEEEEYEEPASPRGPRPTPFGSFWDSQIGMTTMPAASLTPLSEEELEEEPEIPEYLIAERRRGQGQGRARGVGHGQGRSGRGRGGAYAAAIERERYGRGGGGGINRYPDVSGRGAGGGVPRREEPRREERPAPRGVRPGGRSDEPWSEVPPELEEMLRAQVQQRARAGATTTPEPAPKGDSAEIPATAPTTTAAPKRRTTRARMATGAKAEAQAMPPSKAAAPIGDALSEAQATAPTKAAAPKGRPTSGKTPEAKAPATEAPATETAAAPKRRTTRAKAVTTAEVATTDAPARAAGPKRRTTRTSAAAAGEAQSE